MKIKTWNLPALALLMVLLLTMNVPAIQVLAEEGATLEYQVQKNDSLYKIARTRLGSGLRWTEIYELNKEIIKNPSLIYTGQILRLPQGEANPVETPVEDNSQLTEQAETAQEQLEADKYAKQLYAEAKKAEPAVTALLQSMESDKAHLEGLENRLKTVESTSRKILTDAHDMEISVLEASGGIHDSLRYTYIIEDSDYAATTAAITDALIASGISVYKFKNYWANAEVVYQGINALFQTKDGLIFELQFHTPISYYTKGEKTHGWYEIMRSETTSEEEKAAAREKHDAAFAEIPVPEGAKELFY